MTCVTERLSMSSLISENNKKIEIDASIVERLKRKIIAQENMNLKKKEKTNSEMVRKIKQMIGEELKCYSNQ